MVDRVNKTIRSRMMSSVKSKDTAPELYIRKALFAKGLRYTLHNKNLPGAPDLVFAKHKAVIFIHGCFWHNHDCKHGKIPDTNREFWKMKLQGNALRDLQNISKLQQSGWRVKIIWSCSLRNKKAFFSEEDVDDVVDWVRINS